MRMERREFPRAGRMIDPPYDCYVLDLLPESVPEGREVQYAMLKRHFRQPKERKRLTRRLVRLVLKLSCYEHISMQKGLGWISSPPPDRLTDRLRACLAGKDEAVNLMIGRGKAQLVLDSGDLFLSLYTADADCAELISQLAWSEGLFFRRSEE